MSVRHFLLPDKPGWAVAAPSVGPGYISSAFRVDSFQSEAKQGWEEFLEKLQGHHEEDAALDLDPSGLRIPTLKEIADQYVQQSMQGGEKDGSELNSPVSNSQGPAEVTANQSAAQQLDPKPKPKPNTKAKPPPKKNHRGRVSKQPPVEAASEAEDEEEWSDCDAIKRRLTHTARANSAKRQQVGADNASVAAEGPRLTRAQAKAAAEMKQAEKAATRQAANEESGKDKTAPGNARKRKTEEQPRPICKSGEAAATPASRKASQQKKSGAASLAAEENGAADREEPGSCTKSAGGSKGQDSAPASDHSKASGSDKKMLGDKRRKTFAHATKDDIPRLQGIMNEEIVLSRRRGRNIDDRSQRKQKGLLDRHKGPGLPRPARATEIRSPGFGGDLNEIEVQRKAAFLASAQDLDSVRHAVFNPHWYKTPFVVKHEDAHSRVPAKMLPPPHENEERLDQDETVLRVDVREFDTMHVTLQEFLVLGSQKLIDLRDKICCPADRNLKGIGMDVQGAFFYIEGTFYLDKREGRGAEYWRPIVAFCQQHGIAAPPRVPQDAAEALPKLRRQVVAEADERPGKYREVDMSHVTWDEIAVRSGPAAGFVYCHQGCCEHLLVIKDVRRIHPDDPQHASSYPACIQEEAQFRRKCEICQNAMATQVTYEDKQALNDPCFWCSACYRMMHYSKEGSLLYTHKVFPYLSG